MPSRQCLPQSQAKATGLIGELRRSRISHFFLPYPSPSFHHRPPLGSSRGVSTGEPGLPELDENPSLVDCASQSLHWLFHRLEIVEATQLLNRSTGGINGLVFTTFAALATRLKRSKVVAVLWITTAVKMLGTFERFDQCHGFRTHLRMCFHLCSLSHPSAPKSRMHRQAPTPKRKEDI